MSLLATCRGQSGDDLAALQAATVATSLTEPPTDRAQARGTLAADAEAQIDALGG